MQRYYIDGAKMQDRTSAHDELIRALDLPGYYGRNLDALSDLLSGMHAEIRMTGTSKMLNALQGYGCNLLQVLYESPVSFTAE